MSRRDKADKEIVRISLFPNCNIQTKGKGKGSCDCLFPRDSEKVSTPQRFQKVTVL